MSTNAAIIIAHPDDEALFFSGLIQRKRSWKWTVICVTDGNAFHRKVARAAELRRSCQLLGVHEIIELGLKDTLKKPLRRHELKKGLSRINKSFKFVFTHNSEGEYGHRHHQDVSFVVCRFYSRKSKVYSVSWNSYPEIKIQLTKNEFLLKKKLVQEIYRIENRLWKLDKWTFPFEGFSKIK